MSGDLRIERRQRDILGAIVRLYVAQGAPVGSKAVAEQLPEPLSPATIRNVMAELEDEGYLAQPHVSAGRVPTDKAYRVYVDGLAGVARLGKDTQHYIDMCLEPEAGELDRLMEKTSRVLAEVSHHVGVVLSPRLEEKLLEHIKLVKLPDRRILAVIVSRPDLIENKVIRLEEDFSQEELDRIADFLNGEFRGWSLRTIRVEIFKRLEAMKALCDRLVSSVAALFEGGALGDEDESGRLIIEGTAQVLEGPEDLHAIRDLLETLEEKAKLVKILTACLGTPGTGVRALIGRENPVSALQHCTVLVAPYRYRRRVVGAVGVVGPTRMEYDRAITAVEYVACLCSRILSAN